LLATKLLAPTFQQDHLGFYELTQTLLLHISPHRSFTQNWKHNCFSQILFRILLSASLASSNRNRTYRA